MGDVCRVVLTPVTPSDSGIRLAKTYWEVDQLDGAKDPHLQGTLGHHWEINKMEEWNLLENFQGKLYTLLGEILWKANLEWEWAGQITIAGHQDIFSEMSLIYWVKYSSLGQR